MRAADCYRVETPGSGREGYLAPPQAERLMRVTHSLKTLLNITPAGWRGSLASAADLLNQCPQLAQWQSLGRADSDPHSRPVPCRRMAGRL
jgi:hypothetical protein